jgi:hypothetical protein
MDIRHTPRMQRRIILSTFQLANRNHAALDLRTDGMLRLAAEGKDDRVC